LAALAGRPRDAKLVIFFVLAGQAPGVAIRSFATLAATVVSA